VRQQYHELNPMQNTKKSKGCSANKSYYCFSSTGTLKELSQFSSINKIEEELKEAKSNIENINALFERLSAMNNLKAGIWLWQNF